MRCRSQPCTLPIDQPPTMLDRIRRKASISVLPRGGGNDSNDSSTRNSNDTPMSENSSYIGSGSRTAQALENVAQRSTSYDHSSRTVSKLFRRKGGSPVASSSSSSSTTAPPPLPSNASNTSSTASQWNTNGANTVFKSSRLSPFFRQHSHSAFTHHHTSSRPRGHFRSRSSFGASRGGVRKSQSGTHLNGGNTITPVAPPPPMTKEDEDELYRILSSAHRDRQPSYGQQRAAAPSPRGGSTRPFMRGAGIQRNPFPFEDGRESGEGAAPIEPRQPTGDVSDTLYDGQSRGLGITLVPPPRRVPFTGRRSQQDDMQSPPASPPIPSTRDRSPSANAAATSHDGRPSFQHRHSSSTSSLVRRRKPVPACHEDGSVNGGTPEPGAGSSGADSAAGSGSGTGQQPPTNALQSAATAAAGTTSGTSPTYPLRKKSSGTPSANTAMSQMEVLKPSDFASSTSLSSSSASSHGNAKESSNISGSQVRKRPVVYGGAPSSPQRRNTEDAGWAKQQQQQQRRPERASPTPTFGEADPTVTEQEVEKRDQMVASPSMIATADKDEEVEQLELEVAPPPQEQMASSGLNDVPPPTSASPRAIHRPAFPPRKGSSSYSNNTNTNKYLDPELTPTAEHYNVLEKLGLASPNAPARDPTTTTQQRMLLMQGQEAHERRLIALMKRYNAKVQEACTVILETSQRSDGTERRRSVSLFLRPVTAGRHQNASGNVSGGGSVDEGSSSSNGGGVRGGGRFNNTDIRSPGLKTNLDRAELPHIITNALSSVEEDLNASSFERRNELLPSMFAHLIHTHFYQQVVQTFCYGAATGKSTSGSLAMQLVQGLKSEVPLHSLHTLTTHLHKTLLQTTTTSSTLKSTQSSTLTHLQSHLCTLIYWAGLCKRKSDATMFITRAYGRLRDALGLLCEIVRGSRGSEVHQEENQKEMAGLRWYEVECERIEGVKVPVDNTHGDSQSHSDAASTSWISDETTTTSSAQSSRRPSTQADEEPRPFSTNTTLQGLTMKLNLTTIKLPSSSGDSETTQMVKITSPPRQRPVSTSHFSDDTLSAASSSDVSLDSREGVESQGVDVNADLNASQPPPPLPPSSSSPSSQWTYMQYVLHGAKVVLA